MRGDKISMNKYRTGDPTIGIKLFRRREFKAGFQSRFFWPFKYYVDKVPIIEHQTYHIVVYNNKKLASRMMWPFPSPVWAIEARYIFFTLPGVCMLGELYISRVRIREPLVAAIVCAVVITARSGGGISRPLL